MFRLFESRLGDQIHKSLGPVVTYLRFICVWQKDRSKLKTTIFYIFFIFSIVYSANVFIYMMVHFNLNMFYVYIQYSFAPLGVLKMYTYSRNFKDWYKVFQFVVKIEKEALEEVGSHRKYVLRYRTYCHYVPFGFWCMGINFVGLLLIAFWLNNVIEPILENKLEVNPSVMYHAWLPVDPRTISGQFWHTLLQTIYLLTTAIYVWGWDVMVIVFMVFIAGQLRSLRERCVHALDSGLEQLCVKNILKCHQHYLNLQKCTKMLNDLVSNVMFMYFIMISINYGVAIIILIGTQKNLSDMLIALVPVLGLMIQLLLIYAMGNEVIVQNQNLMYGIFESDWYSKSYEVQRAVFMLSMGLRQRIALSAGPFHDMSLSTFVSILRSIYSFYTLLSRRSQ